MHSKHELEHCSQVTRERVAVVLAKYLFGQENEQLTLNRTPVVQLKQFEALEHVRQGEMHLRHREYPNKLSR